jgi:hypothetical protein
MNADDGDDDGRRRRTTTTTANCYHRGTEAQRGHRGPGVGPGLSVDYAGFRRFFEFPTSPVT